jgi:drug/metabolite transporter (DMT)-like permease
MAALPFWTWPTATQFGWLVAIGVLGTLAQLLLTQAMKDADATLVMPFDFLKLIWASLLGYVFFAQSPTAGTWAGGAVIFAAATYIAYREGTLARRAQKAAER